MDPHRRLTLTRTEVVKFRISPKTKRAVEQAAIDANLTVSGLMRGLIVQAVDGRTVDGRVREDMLTVRAASSTLLELLDQDEAGFDRSRAGSLARILHTLAMRHLGPTP